MNRRQRQYGRWCQRHIQETFDIKNKVDGINDLMGPKRIKPIEQRTQTVATKKQNRSCFTDTNADLNKMKKFINSTTEKYPIINLDQDQYGFDPALPENIVGKIQEVLGQPLIPLESKIVVPMKYPEKLKQEKYVQYRDSDMKTQYVKTTDNSPTRWRPLDKAEDIDMALEEEQVAFTEPSPPKIEKKIPKRIKISKEPKLKVVAKIFSKFTKNVIELRKLEEKIVCVEYDVTDEEKSDKPVQKLRAFFRISPVQKPDEGDLYDVPSKIKHTYDIHDEDLLKLNEKEIEIIDDSIPENIPYLNDLKKLLKRNNDLHSQKAKDTFDLKYLYEIAKMESHVQASKSIFFSKTAMKGMKDFILSNCVSSAHGISRKSFKNEAFDLSRKSSGVNIASRSIVNELLRGIHK